MTSQTSSETILPCSSQFVTAIIYQLSTFHPQEQPAAAPTAIDDTPSYYNNSNTTNSTTNNRLSTLSPDALSKVKPLLLTLHSLFPNELLLALDILDRKLVTRYTIQQDKDEDENENEDDGAYMPESNDGYCGVYFVRSLSVDMASTRSGRTHAHAHPSRLEKNYEVCINSWNCTCPAFSLAAFRDLALEDFDDGGYRDGHCHEQTQSQQRDQAEKPAERQEARGTWDDEFVRTHGSQRKEWMFGGCLTRGSSYCSSSYPSACCFMLDTPPICKHLLACVLGSQCPELFGGGVEVVTVSTEELAARHAGWGG